MASFCRIRSALLARSVIAFCGLAGGLSSSQVIRFGGTVTNSGRAVNGASGGARATRTSWQFQSTTPRAFSVAIVIRASEAARATAPYWSSNPSGTPMSIRSP